MIANPTKSQKYDIWLHWFVTNQCNFDCTYCFGKVPIDKKWLRQIQTDKLLNVLNASGKTFRISFTGGEPFLIPNLIKACCALTQNHFISVNSNLILPAVKEFAESINPERVIFVQASFHPVELKEKNLLSSYIDNFLLLREKGFEVVAEAVAFPPNLELLNHYKSILKNENIKLVFAPYIGKQNNNPYPISHSEDDILNFPIERERIGYHYQKGDLCNAGKNVGVIYSNGDVYPCFQIKEKIGNVYEGFNFSDDYRNCPAKFCGCPLNKYDPGLF